MKESTEKKATRLAAIDIGSNAVRLLLAESYDLETMSYKKLKLYRVPVRLGAEVFSTRKISPPLYVKLKKALKAFRLLMDVYEIEEHKIYATSALREAKNQVSIITNVWEDTGLQIELITGQTEAKLILSSNDFPYLDKRFSYLYVDVGGGSTELSLFNHKKVAESESFKVGTVRIFLGKDKVTEWKRMEKWLRKNILQENPLAILGSGGNINRIFKRARKIPGQPLFYRELKKEYDTFAPLSIHERVLQQDVTRDRAEVIVPAMDIFLKIMDVTGIQQVIVPKVGLADGMIRLMISERQKHLKLKTKANKSKIKSQS